ncbi:hypothetical protein [Nocardioides aequoreus]|uniref:hypothetical protein n=1 Tax=Nocardioides aequoreus TaxID=397278 RepID=UPI0004C3FD9D|nr:hypothetical protein [Nocardioides aequoreus]
MHQTRATGVASCLTATVLLLSGCDAPLASGSDDDDATSGARPSVPIPTGELRLSTDWQSTDDSAEIPSSCEESADDTCATLPQTIRIGDVDYVAATAYEGGNGELRVLELPASLRGDAASAERWILVGVIGEGADSDVRVIVDDAYAAKVQPGQPQVARLPQTPKAADPASTPIQIRELATPTKGQVAVLAVFTRADRKNDAG